jgi:crotonobetainyl-CoA:carnitine CoA-transferase CaiB-like acyl-CoA transferase
MEMSANVKIASCQEEARIIPAVFSPIRSEFIGVFVNKTNKPLSGIRVLEMGQLIAGPYAGAMLAYFGADVVKIEPPGGGDPIRQWRVMKDGTSLWWYSIGRNKRSIAIDLKTDEGRALAKELANEADVLIENFRPGVMEKWGLGPEVFKTENPDLIYARVSGYGQTGPYAEKPGFASVCEAISGFRYLNGFADEAPVRPNISMGDTVAALHAVIGILLALNSRLRNQSQGQIVDIAIYEAMFNLMEGIVPEYSGAGVIREPSGTTVTGIVPTNTYRCKDGKYVVIGANGDSLFKRLMQTMGRDDLANNPELEKNPGRVIHEKMLDDAINAWCGQYTMQEVISLLEAAKVPVGPIYNVADMFEDKHFRARELFEPVSINGETLELPAISPKLSETPGGTEWPGAKVGEHTDEVLRDWLKK